LRFVDSNIFLHAFLIPRRKLTGKEMYVKEEAKAIVKRIEGGEDAATTTVHLSEVVNIIETGLSLQKSLELLIWATTSESIKVHPVAVEDYKSVIQLARDSKISANDALAYLSMKTHKLKEIYSFDKHFDRLKDIVRLPKTPAKHHKD